MADQRVITLYEGDATPKDIVLRELPVATPSAGTTIYLYAGDATPKDVILRDPRAEPTSSGSDLDFTLEAGAVTLAGQTVTVGVSQSLTNGSVTFAGQTLAAAVGQEISGGAITFAGQTLSAAVEQGITGGAVTLAGQSLGAAVSAQIGGGAIGIAGQDVSAGIGITISAPGIEIAGQTLLFEIGVTLGGGAVTVAGQTLDFAITGGTTEQPSGGFVYISAYERRLRKFEEDQRRIEEAKASEASIQDELDAQIAALLHEQEAKDLERADLARLQALADEYKGRTPDLSERVQKALLEAQERRTFGALQALKRETDRMMEEEELVLLLLLLNE